ncbi:unnamed protein product, partial [Penicillium salamii]
GRIACYGHVNISSSLIHIFILCINKNNKKKKNIYIYVVWINQIKFYIDRMNFSIFLFLIGILGFVLNRKNIILMLISIEIMLLSVTFLILISSLSFDDILGQTFAVYILTIAGAESAIGLGILVAYYRLRVSGFFGRKVGITGSHIITCGSVITTTLLAIIAFFEVGFNNIPVTINVAR